MEDAIGQRLYVGDVVIYIGMYSKKPRVCTVVSLYDDCLDIRSNTNSIVFKEHDYSDVVNIHAQYLKEFPEKFL